MLRQYFILLLLTLSLTAYALRPEDVINVQLRNHDCYVTDMCGVLTDAERAELDERCVRLREQVGVEIAIVIVDQIYGDDEYDFANRLFNLWHIGDSRNNSGVLWLYVTSLRAMKIETGVGVEGLLPDGFLKRVLEESVFPLMKEEKSFEAFSVGLRMIDERLTSDEAREELVMSNVDDRTFLADIILLYLAIGFILMMLLAVVFYSRWQHMIGPNNRKYAQITKPYNLIKALAFPFPIPLLLLFLTVRRSRRSLRYMPMNCPKCGKAMRVLSEAEEDSYLTQVQQAEESVHTVDYDVWLCPECGETKILDYEEYASAMYKRCPQCGGHTYKKVAEKILIPPTALSSGRGERVFRCSSCGMTQRVPFVIPPVPVVIGGGGSGSGGGFSGGGFGGGFSAGGGAGGRF